MPEALRDVSGAFLTLDLGHLEGTSGCFSVSCDAVDGAVPWILSQRQDEGLK